MQGVDAHTVCAAGRSTFDLAVGIARPCSDVFALLADVQDVEPIPRRATVRMTKAPSGATTVGTRWDERVRLAPGLWLHIRSTVTGVEPPHRLGMQFTTAFFTGHLTYLVEPSPTGSVLHQRETLRPRWWVRPVGSLIGRRLAPRLAQRLADLKEVLEDQRVPGRSCSDQGQG